MLLDEIWVMVVIVEEHQLFQSGPAAPDDAAWLVAMKMVWNPFLKVVMS